MPGPLDPAPDYHLALTDQERTFMEQTAFNYRQHRGAKMRIPPRLFSDLKRAGVNMTNMEPDAALDN